MAVNLAERAAELLTKYDATQLARLLADSENKQRYYAVLAANRAAELEELKTTSHPEETCDRCGGPNIVWFVDSALWNAVMRIPDDSEIGYHTRNGYPDSEIICPRCFVEAYEKETGELAVWELRRKP